MENPVKGGQSAPPEQKLPAKKAGPKKDAIPLRPVERDVAASHKQRNYFLYQRGKTKIECEGNPEKVIRLAMIDTICRWVGWVLIAGLSIYFTNTSAQKILGKRNVPDVKRSHNEVQIRP